MMSYEEAAAEIKKRRDECVAKRKAAYKKLAITLCALFVCASAGVGTWMLTRDGEEPNIPGTDTVETGDVLIEVPDWTPEPYVHEENTNSNDDQNMSQCPRPVYLNEFIETDEMCIIDEDTQLPETLPVYYSKLRTGVVNEEYSAKISIEEKESFLKLIYGENFEDLLYHKAWYYINDPYIEPNPNGDTFIRHNSEYILIPLEITRAEEYRDMSYREALEYATSTKYYKAIYETLGLDEVKSSGYVSSTKTGINNSYTYSFLVASPKSDFTDGMLKNTESYIHIEMSFVRTKGYEKIRLVYYAYRQFDENSAGYEKTVEQKTVPISEAVESAMNTYSGRDLENTGEVLVRIEYSHSGNPAWNTPDCVMPFYKICFKLKDPEGGYSYSEIVAIAAVEDMKGYYADSYY